jgi:hypothetical protein
MAMVALDFGIRVSIWTPSRPAPFVAKVRAGKDIKRALLVE